MGVFSRSWEISKTSFGIMKKEKELFVFPILSIIFSALFLIAIAIPFVLSSGLDNGLTVIHYVMIFVVYFGLAFVATFFNVCVVYTAKRAFANEEATFGNTIGYAFSKIHLIFLWSVVLATVGIILNLIEAGARKTKGGGRFALMALKSVLGFAWGLITMFVVPAMVYDDLIPFAAIKKSAGVLRKTWGESLVKGISIGIFTFLFIILGAIVIIPIIIFTLGVSWILTLVLILVLIIYIFAVIMIFSVFEKIFDTALYVYAEKGRVVGFDANIMRSAVVAEQDVTKVF
jgi:hypothetical protein